MAGLFGGCGHFDADVGSLVVASLVEQCGCSGRRRRRRRRKNWLEAEAIMVVVEGGGELLHLFRRSWLVRWRCWARYLAEADPARYLLDTAIALTYSCQNRWKRCEVEKFGARYLC